MNRKTALAPGEFYHVYNRGVDKRPIFLDAADYKRFVNILFFCNGGMSVNMRELTRNLSKGGSLVDFIEIRGKTFVDIGAYCLMPNHFHLLMHEKVENGITLFLKKLCTAYSMYFNTKYKRTGKLFERAFSSEHADTDQYLKYLFSYIHLNPAKLIEPNWKDRESIDRSRINAFVENYTFSSYRNYLGEKEYSEILNAEPFPKYFEDYGMKEEIVEWLDFAKQP